MKILYTLSADLANIDKRVIFYLIYPYPKVRWCKYQSRKLVNSLDLYYINQESVQPYISYQIFKEKDNIYLTCRNRASWEENKLNYSYEIFKFITENVLICISMYIADIYNYFISIAVKSSKIRLLKFRCTSKLFCQIFGSLYFIGLINLNI